MTISVESGQPNHVTELRWSDDSRKIYAGDLKGQVSCTRIQVLLFYSLHIPKLSSVCCYFSGSDTFIKAEMN